MPVARARPSSSAPTPPRRDWWSVAALPSGPRRNFPPSRRLHRADRPRHWSPPRLMNRRLVLLVLLVLVALLALAALPATAPAAWFPAGVNPPIDGPSPDIDRLGGVDLARDGTGGL